MRNKKEMEVVQTFCRELSHDFLSPFVEEIKEQNEQILESLLSDLKTSFHTGKQSYLFKKEDTEMLIKRKHFELAINMLNWLLEE